MLAALTHLSVDWLSGDVDDIMVWSTRETNETVYHQLEMQSPIRFATKSGQSADASVWYAMGREVCLAVVSVDTLTKSGAVQTYPTSQTANSDLVNRGGFVRGGVLTDTIVSPPKAISECVALHIHQRERLLLI